MLCLGGVAWFGWEGSVFSVLSVVKGALDSRCGEFVFRAGAGGILRRL